MGAKAKQSKAREKGRLFKGKTAAYDALLLAM
jgi:hypothetical protein